jgi:hypothetical protein
MPSEPEEFSQYRLIEPTDSLKRRVLAAASTQFMNKRSRSALLLNSWFLTSAAMLIISVAATHIDSWLTSRRSGSGHEARPLSVASRPTSTEREYAAVSPLLLSMMGGGASYIDSLITEGP